MADEFKGKNIITEVDTLDSGIPLNDETKMYVDTEMTFRQIPLSKLFDWLKGKLTLVVYPIGSVYMSFTDTNPRDLFGGTWQKVDSKFLMGSGANHSVRSTGGQETVTLTANQMPIHSHSGSSSETGSHTHSGSTGAVGNHSHTITVADNGLHSHSPSKSGYAFTVNTFIGNTGNAVARRQMQYTGNSGYWAMTTTTNMDNIHQAQTTSSNGSHSHTATASENGSHSHNISVESNGKHTHDINIGNAGGGASHNNMPPYIVVNIWERIG